MSVAHAAHSRNSHTTHLYFDEPLLYSASASPGSAFRRFATLTLPGSATSLSFFRQTVAVVTEKQFIIAEPGNPAHNSIPTFPPDLPDTAPIMRMIGGGARALGMYQVKENEFLLVYHWGACYVTKCELSILACIFYRTFELTTQTERYPVQAPISAGTLHPLTLSSVRRIYCSSTNQAVAPRSAM